MALWLGLLAALATGQATEQPPRPEVAVVVVTLDNVRQFQTRHGRSALATLGDERWGRFRWVESPVTAERFASCEDEPADDRLDYCVRYYLTRADRAADAPPIVVVAFDDRSTPERRRRGEMRVQCFGRGVAPVRAEAQDTWLWPESARLHGAAEWERDRDALAACIEAAAAERITGLREPD